MKKIIYILLFSTLFSQISCNEEHQSVDEQENTTLKKEYLKMVSSTTYIKFNKEVDDFIENTNFKDNLLSINEANIIKYSNNNSQTNLMTVNQALLKYNNLKILSQNLVNENKLFLKILSKSKKEDFVGILQVNSLASLNSLKPKDFLNQIQTNPTFDCINQAVACGRDADQAYATAMGVSASTFWMGNPFGAAAAALAGSFNHGRAQRSCARSLDYCMRSVQ